MQKILFLSVILFLNSCATLQEPTPQQLSSGNYQYVTDYMIQFIEREMKASDVPGLSIALIDDQDIVWSQGFGFIDKENKVKASEQTIYRAGSVSKTFTAMAVMQLAEQGKIDLDKPLSTYLPEFSIKSRFGSTDEISLRNIMSHHSGLPSDLIDGMWCENPESFKTVVDNIKDEYVAYPPESIFAYSNIGVSLAGHAIENVSGQDFESYMDTHLLSPMGMAKSDFSGKFATKGYLNGELISELPFRDTPAGGLNSNVVELSNLVKMFNANGHINDKQLINVETLKEMMTSQNDAVALDVGKRLGLGLFFYDDVLGKEHKVVGHAGQTIAHSALVLSAPELKLGVVILANSPGNASLDKIGKKVMRLSLPVKTGSSYTEVDTQYPSNLSSEEIDLAGHYAGPKSIGLTEVKGSSDSYTAEAVEKTFALKKEAKNLYSLQYKLLGFIPLGIDEVKVTAEHIAGHTALVGHYQGTQFLLGNKIKPSKKQINWDKHTGLYKVSKSREGEEVRYLESMMIKYMDGLYIAEVKNEDGSIINYPIEPVKDNEAVILGLGRHLSETIHVTNIDGVTTLEYAGLKFKRAGNS